MPSENVIHHVAIHELVKAENDHAFTVKHGKFNHAVTVPLQRVVDELHQRYAKRASKSHGVFAADIDNYPTQRYVKDYVEGGATDFRTLTTKLMSRLAEEARRKGGATGGFVFFAHFSRDGKSILMVAIVTNRLGAALTRAMEVQDVEHLDVDGFRFAGRINLTAWEAGEPRYIGFLRGKGDVAEYFQQFLGCDTTVLDRVDTTTLVRVMREFADESDMTSEERADFLRRVKDVGDRLGRNREPIDFQAFANEVHPTDPDALVEKLGDPDLGLSEGFVPDRRALHSLVTFKTETRLWSVRFEREALTEEQVRYLDDEGALVIYDLPEDLREQLRREASFEDDQPDV